MTQVLDASAVNKSIDKSILIPSSGDDDDKGMGSSHLPKQLEAKYGFTLRRATKDEDWQLLLRGDCIDGSSSSSNISNMKTPWFFGIVVCDRESNKVGLITFYIAYSTWNGRVLYLDEITWEKQNGMTDTTDIEQHLLRILASIAVDLNFARITWRHHKDTTPKWHFEIENRPEMHGEVLTLSMNANAMKEYANNGRRGGGEKETDIITPWVSNQTNTIINKCLQTMNNDLMNNDKHFRVRLAQGEDDLKAIGRLVQGLADYVKESDSVHIGIDEYRIDGCYPSKDCDDENAISRDPLYYCLLLDSIDKESGDIIQTCGFACCYFGYSVDGGSDSSGGRFLYLEDLFIEVEYRQNGGGNLMMKTLAQICLALGGKHMVWQALDWNVGSLNFYKRIGATILDGIQTSRYCDDAMKVFAEN